jgi:molybdate transport system substrate-binding protein
MSHSFLIWILGWVVILAGVGCGRTAVSGPNGATTKKTLTVFAASSLAEAFPEIGREFEAVYPGTRVIFNFAGSQQLVQQLALGAPADIFASADQQQMNAAARSGRIAAGAARPFSHNRLVLVTPSGNHTRVTTLEHLNRPGLRLILAAPEAPAGQYTLAFLEKAAADPRYGPEFIAAVYQNVVSYEQNVRAVLTKVALGEADAGIVYSSDVASGLTGRVRAIDIPDSLNLLITYPIAPVNDSSQPNLAQAFIDFVLAPAGQEILARYGFIPFTTP